MDTNEMNYADLYVENVRLKIQLAKMGVNAWTEKVEVDYIESKKAKVIKLWSPVMHKR